MNYVLISSHNVDVARMLARVAGGFFLCVFFLRGSQSKSWVTAAGMLKQGRNRKRHRPLPSPLPHRFLFRPRFCFRAVVSLTLRNAKHKGKHTTKNPPSVTQTMHMFGCVQWRWEKGSNGFSISKARKMLRPCWNKVYRKSNRLDISMRRPQMVSTSTVNNTFKKNMLKQSWICLTEAFFE